MFHLWSSAGLLIFENRITLYCPYANKLYLNALEMGALPRRTSYKSKWNKFEAVVPNGVAKMNQTPLFYNFNSCYFLLLFKTYAFIFKWQRLSDKLLLHNFISPLYTGWLKVQILWRMFYIGNIEIWGNTLFQHKGKRKRERERERE